jgi:hypothetical protein
MRGWLGANLFMFAVALIAAALIFAELALVRALGLSDDAEHYVMPFAGLIALVLTFFTARWLHGRLARVIERRSWD